MNNLIFQLESAKEQAFHEINKVSMEIEDEIKRFSEMKIKDWNNMLRSLIAEQVKYHEEVHFNTYNRICKIGKTQSMN